MGPTAGTSAAVSRPRRTNGRSRPGSRWPAGSSPLDSPKAVAERWRDLINRPRAGAHIPPRGLGQPVELPVWHRRIQPILVEAVECPADVQIFADLNGEVVDWSAEEGVVRVAGPDKSRSQCAGASAARTWKPTSCTCSSTSASSSWRSWLGLFDALLAVCTRSVVVTLHATHKPTVDDHLISLRSIAGAWLASIDYHDQASRRRPSRRLWNRPQRRGGAHGCATLGGVKPRDDVRRALRFGDQSQSSPPSARATAQGDRKN